MKRECPEWPRITVPCPDNITSDLLRYWDWILTPREGEWVHPQDKKDQKKYRAAIKVLLEFFE
jgi:diphthamide synthase subunit DPH2